MVSNGHLPPPAQVIARIAACREELAALKKLLRASRAAADADAAQARRRALENAAGQDVAGEKVAGGK